MSHIPKKAHKHAPLWAQHWIQLVTQTSHSAALSVLSSGCNTRRILDGTRNHWRGVPGTPFLSEECGVVLPGRRELGQPLPASQLEWGLTEKQSSLAHTQSRGSIEPLSFMHPSCSLTLQTRVTEAKEAKAADKPGCLQKVAPRLANLTSATRRCQNSRRTRRARSRSTKVGGSRWDITLALLPSLGAGLGVLRAALRWASEHNLRESEAERIAGYTG